MVLVTSLILIAIVVVAAISRKLNIPLIIIALAIGIFFGSDVTGIIYFDDALLTQKIANIALVFVLFAGGFGTKSHHFKPVIRPTLLLATGGVLITALVSASLFMLCTGWNFTRALLLCAITSSTDAAAVFSILHNRSLKGSVASITEIESAANDPMAIVSTGFIIQLFVGVNFTTLGSIGLFLWQLAGGVGFGVVIGYIGVYLFNKIKELDVGYLYLFLIGMILLSFGLADLCKASGMLSAFFAGFMMGNKTLPYKNGLSSFTQILSFISNVALFILLGLLVFPKQFSAIWGIGVILFLLITLIGRPVAVFLCTLFTTLTIKEKLFLSWSGIRGAVPIVLATYPAAAGIDPHHEMFNIVFFAVTLSILLQGTTISKLADILKLSVKNKTRAKQTMALVTLHDTNYELAEIFIDEDLYQGNCLISEIKLPVGTTITMINRDTTIIAPSGHTELHPGDILSVLTEKQKIEEVTTEVIRMFREEP